MRLATSALAGVLLAAAVPSAAAADDLIVRFKSSASAADRAAARAAAGVAESESLPLADSVVVKTLPGVDAPAALKKLAADGAVEYAEPDAKIKKHAVPNDRFFPDQWNLPAIGAPGAWDVITAAPQATVAVVDGGIDLTHPDLRPNLYVNDGERAGNGRDDDRNGYVDDVHGYDFAGHDGTPQDSGDGHGSHVAGIIGAQGNNGDGIAGVAWGARLLGLRVLTAEGEGDISDAIKAYGYALRAGARVINVSWGGDRFVRAERDMIADAPNVLFVVSSGNTSENADEVAQYPCNHDLTNIICVAASDQQDALASFSNYGPRNVDIAAPGVSIPSAIPGPAWSREDGTSMAAPHVAGAAALLLGRAPNASVADLRRVLLETAEPKPGLAGRVATGARLNLAGAVGAAGAIAGSAASSTPPARRRLPPPDRSRPRVRVLSASPGRDLRRLLARGLRTRIRCSETCALSVEIVASHDGDEIVLARRRTSVPRAGAVTARLRLARAFRGEVRRSRFLRARLRVRATDAAGNVASTIRRFTWRKR